MSRRPHIVVSLGDPCGIGPELLLSSLPSLLDWAEVTVVGSKAGVDLLEGLPGARVAWRWVETRAKVIGVAQAKAQTLQVLSLGDASPRVLAEALWLDPTPEIKADQLHLGEGSAASGRATVEAVRAAALMTMAGAADALVTLPMAKSAAHLAGYDLPGHTEFLRDLSGSAITRMAFVSPQLNVVLHTVHQSLRSVVESITADGVAETLIFAADRFSQLTGKTDLRVALCALNPHGGEQGAFGEEERLLEEAIMQAGAAFLSFPASAATDAPVTRPDGHRQRLSGGQRGVEVFSTAGAEESRPTPLFFGPLPSDSVFQRASQGEFDLVVALYHDQGLIPIKLLEPTRAVNLTLGLPFIRTSPDHGTAFDKAGKWVADSRNFLAAAALAIRLAGKSGLDLPSPGA